MYIHNFFETISQRPEGDRGSNSFSGFFSSSKVTFHYNIGGTSYTLDDIKHGMLRGNKCKPGHMMRVLSTSDPKTNILPRSIQGDPRVNFVCLDFPDFVEHIEAIRGEDQDELGKSLDDFVGEILNAKVNMTNQLNGSIAVPNLVMTYRSDFGKTDQSIIEFIYPYLDNPELKMNEILQQINM